MSSILAQRFRQEVSKHKDFRMKNESEFEVGYPTGFLNFDFLNGTIVHVRNEDGSMDFKYYSIGIVDGTMVAVIGRSTGGKSTWIMQAATNIIRPYKTSCIFEDSTEAGLTQTRKEVLSRMPGHELKKKLISRNTGITAENFYERIKMIHDMKTNNETRSDYEYDTGLYDTLGNRIYKLEPTVYILDSIAILMPEKFADEDELSGNSAAMSAARVVTGIMKRIVPMLKSANIILFVVNHILENPQLTIVPTKGQLAYLKQNERLPVGKTFIHLCNNIIRLDDSKLKADKDFHINGALVDFSLVKARSTFNGQVTTLVLDFETGYDAELSLFLLLKQHDKLDDLKSKSGVKFTQKDFKSKLNSEPTFRQVFMEEVISILKQIPVETQSNIPEYDITGDIMGMINSIAA